MASDRWDATTPGLVLLRDVRPGTPCQTITGSIITRLAGFDHAMPKMEHADGMVGYMVRSALVRPLSEGAA